MNIIERGQAFVQFLRELASRSVWDWRRCVRCGSTLTCKWGHYHRHPWFLTGKRVVAVQRHRCWHCHRTYGEASPWLVCGSWYAREVHRCAIDHWQHLGTSLRRTAEALRSWLGRQERWQLWCPLVRPGEEACHLAASTVHRWLDQAGQAAQGGVQGQLAGIGQGQVLGTDGLWAQLKGKVQRVVLLVVDSVSGLLYPPVVAEGEEREEPWQRLFARAQEAGLDLDAVRGVTSDGARGLLAYLRQGLAWVQHQRCVWHIWLNLGQGFTQAIARATAGLAEAMVRQVGEGVRRELVTLVRGVMDAGSYEAAEEGLAALREHIYGDQLAQSLNIHLDRLLVHLLDYCRGLQRVSPEWYWRDFRLRLSRGRNHGSEQRLERAALVWAIYHNFEPAQWRSERQRHYRHPGQCALQVAGVPPGQVSYLDALGV